MAETYKETIDRLKRVFDKGAGRASLYKAEDELAALLKLKALSEENRQRAEVLLVRVSAKVCRLNYIDSGFSEEQRTSLRQTALSWLEFCNKNGRENDAAFDVARNELAALIHGLDFAGSYLSGIFGIAEAAGNIDELNKAAETIEKKLSGCDEAFMPYPDMAAPVRSRLEEAAARINEVRGEMQKKLYGAVLNSLTVKTKEYSAYNYYPKLLDNEQANARVTVVCSPFPDDVRLMASKFAGLSGAKLAEVNLAPLAAENADTVDYCIKALKASGDVIFLLTGLDGAAGENVCNGAIALADTARLVLVYDPTGFRSVFKKLKDLRPGGVAVVNLSVPDYGQTVEIFREAGFLTAEDDGDFIKHKCFAFGYIGLNEAVAAGRSGWRARAEACAERNLAAFIRFYGEVPVGTHLIDEGWEYDSGRVFDKPLGARKPFDYDYDTVPQLAAANIRAITDDPAFSLLQKCGLLVRYCITLGADVSVWKDLDDEIREEYTAIATKLLARLLNTKYAPEVIFEDEMGKAGGLCVGGGLQIKYKRGNLGNIEWLMETVCHEVYHSFQHTCIDEGWKDWHLDELHIMKKRVAEWQWNSANYIPLERHEKAYRAQVMEADARIFASEAMSAATGVWSRIKFVV